MWCGMCAQHWSCEAEALLCVSQKQRSMWCGMCAQHWSCEAEALPCFIRDKGARSLGLCDLLVLLIRQPRLIVSDSACKFEQCTSSHGQSRQCLTRIYVVQDRQDSTCGHTNASYLTIHTPLFQPIYGHACHHLHCRLCIPDGQSYTVLVQWSSFQLLPFVQYGPSHHHRI